MYDGHLGLYSISKIVMTGFDSVFGHENLDVGQTGLVRERERERERNVLFNDALNTFYLRLYGVRHMVKDHSDSEKGNPLPPHRLLLSRALLYAPSHRQDNTYHGLCYTSRGALATICQTRIPTAVKTRYTPI